MVSTLLQLGQTVYPERERNVSVLNLKPEKLFFALASRGNTDKSMAFSRTVITAQESISLQK